MAESRAATQALPPPPQKEWHVLRPRGRTAAAAMSEWHMDVWSSQKEPTSFCSRESWRLETGIHVNTWWALWSLKRAWSRARWWVLQPFHQRAWLGLLSIKYQAPLKHTVSLIATVAQQGRCFEAHFIRKLRPGVRCSGISPDLLWP